MVNKQGDCFKLTILKGKYYSYTPNLLASDSIRLATFLTPHYQSGNGLLAYQNRKDGVETYEKIKKFIDSYQKLNSCPSVNDLGATYNALAAVVGAPSGLPQIIKSNSEMKTIRDNEFKRALDYRTKYGTNQSSSGRRSEANRAQQNEMKAHRGITGGRILIDIQSIKQRVSNEKRIAEEKRVKIELDRELKIIEEKRIIEGKRIAKEQKRIAEEKIISDQKIAQELILIQNQSITFNEQTNSGDFNETPITDVNVNSGCSECTGTEIRSDPIEVSSMPPSYQSQGYHKMPDGSLMKDSDMEKEPLNNNMKMAGIAGIGIIGLLLYTRSVKK